jgi:adenylosuccinate synthase
LSNNRGAAFPKAAPLFFLIVKQPTRKVKMKKKKIFTVTDLGGGDGGKGGVVHGVCVRMDAHTVIKVGGAQGSHGVRTSRGERFNFSQFGCGTFEGTRTHISPLMVVEPFGILSEGSSLRFEHGVSNAFDLLTVDEDCLCALPFHGIASRVRELARKGNQKGTVGVGVGEAKLDSELHPDLALYVRDIGRPGLRDKIEAIRIHQRNKLSDIIGDVSALWSADQDIAKSEICLLDDPGFVDWMMEQLERFNRQVKVVGTSYLEKEILSRDGVAVVESSHGILTDRYHGFHPYVSRLRTLPSATLDLLDRCGYDGDIVRLGVTRAYQIRHGAGPMVTEDPAMCDVLLPDSSKDENRWQGKVRVGPLDFVALRYSIEVCGGVSAFDGIAVTWFDQIMQSGNWRVCDGYEGVLDPVFFSPSGDILVRRGNDESQVRHQEELGVQLMKCRPKVDEIIIETESEEFVAGVCSEIMLEKLGVPVSMISFGSTEKEKVYL